MSIARIGTAMIGSGALALAACSGGPARIGKTPPAPVSAPASEAEAALDLLMAGKEGAARKALKAILKRDPMNPTALMLRDSIDRDPKDLLGPQSYPYTVRAGDTLPGLAQRFLGNRMKAYQLVRYNGLKAPVALSASQVLRIPGEPRVEPVRRAEPELVGPAPSASGTAKPRVATPKPATPAGNPAAARQLRTSGLTALNQGSVDRAVGLLRRASQLDPGNPAIARDLARAERIAATVRARK